MKEIKMKTKLISIAIISLVITSCNKEDLAAKSWAEESEHLSIKWKVEHAFINNSGEETGNGEDVLYDWEKWSVQFWNTGAYRIIDYSPDSLVSIMESGTWQLATDGEMILKGSESLIDFDSGSIIDEGTTERFWSRKKNEDNQFWVWIENSFYATNGVFLKMIPF